MCAKQAKQIKGAGMLCFGEFFFFGGGGVPSRKVGSCHISIGSRPAGGCIPKPTKKPIGPETGVQKYISRFRARIDREWGHSWKPQ